jgi:hypothetical protein
MAAEIEVKRKGLTQSGGQLIELMSTVDNRWRCQYKKKRDGGRGGSGKNRFHWLLIDQSGAEGNNGKIRKKMK